MQQNSVIGKMVSLHWQFV